MRPLRITKITTPTDNFRDWVQFYSHVLRPYYQDFIIKNLQVLKFLQSIVITILNVILIIEKENTNVEFIKIIRFY